ncbi:MAG: TonB-dependent receptor [Gemmatimonadetes bacterium]|nr:TonB-dependent receptor [Gemmatimonadota bacterium]
MRFFPIPLLAACIAMPVSAQATRQKPDSTARADSARLIRSVLIVGEPEENRSTSALQRLTLPATARVTASQAARTVNLVDPEDAVKYLPGVFIRKRNNGDTQSTVGTRTWGVGSSARTLVFADGVPLTALIANNNTIGGPRWGLVSPEEVSRVDMMFGPFSAAYAGNSMGAVMEITTRQPDVLTYSIAQTHSRQRFSLYGTESTFGTGQTNATLGDRFGKFSFWASANHQKSESQPLTYVTSATIPAGTTGAFTQFNKLGAPANILGATGLLETGMTNAKVKIAYDIAPDVRASYTYALWRNDAASATDTYLARGSTPTLASQAGFATGTYFLDQRHSAQSFALRTDRDKDWDYEAVWSQYAMEKDEQRFPTSITAADTASAAGRIAVLAGTGWSTLDLRAAWHRGGSAAAHVVAFGAHSDLYELDNPTYSATNWRYDPFRTVFSTGRGKTGTRALWVQDAWTIRSGLKLTVGGRYESWRAFDGYNKSGTVAVTQPERSMTRFSPKAVLNWVPSTDWTLSASLAKAYRFATPAELYQLVTTGVTFTSPAPDLRPDDVVAAELRATRHFAWGQAQAVLFQDDVHDAIISQFLPLVQGSPTLFSYLANVDHVRSRGIEASLNTHDLMMNGLELMFTGTYLDARTLALSGRASATAPAGTAVGKFLPNIPKWRASFLATFRPGPRTSLTLGGRYSDKLYSTLDNADVNPNTYQGFADWFVLDMRAAFQATPHWNWSVGIDNVLDRKYFLFHPFPNRTVVASAKFSR